MFIKSHLFFDSGLKYITKPVDFSTEILVGGGQVARPNTLMPGSPLSPRAKSVYLWAHWKPYWAFCRIPFNIHFLATIRAIGETSAISP